MCLCLCLPLFPLVYYSCSDAMQVVLELQQLGPDFIKLGSLKAKHVRDKQSELIMARFDLKMFSPLKGL